MRLPPAHIGQAAILLGLLAIDATAALAFPILAAGQFSKDVASCVPVILLTVLLTLTLIGLSGGYAPFVLQRCSEQIRLVLAAAAAAIGATALSAWAFDAGHRVNPDWSLAAALCGLAGIGGGRAVAGWLLARERTGIAAPRTIVIGGGPIGAALMAEMLSPQESRNGTERVRLIGYVDGAPTAAGAPFLGGLAELLELIRTGSVDRVVIALPWSAQAPVLELIRQLSECPVQVQLARDPHFGSAAARRRQSPHAPVNVMDPPISGLASLFKRSEDILIAAILLIPCLPIMAAVALLIRLDTPGPVLFRQQRTGFNNRAFEMLKFRSMHHHLADPDARVQATHDDPRVTRIGAWLRRSSLDELPQIFNVLRGDMSIVGPRPHAPGTCAGGRIFDQVVAHYGARHRVRPGVTGLAQVRGLRGPTETEDKLRRRVDSDLEYIENWSIWLDLLVLMRTAFIVVRMKNAC